MWNLLFSISSSRKKLGLVNKEKEIYVKAPGGELIIEVNGDDVYMKGPAEVVFEGNTLI